MTILKKKLLDYINTNETNIPVLEKESGVGRNFIQSILNNKSKNPGIEGIVKIADALGCSLDELFDRQDFIEKYNREHRSKIKFDPKLLKSCTDFLFERMMNEKLELDLGTFYYLLEEIYEYNINIDNKEVDVNFANWLIKNYN